jgi:hypothetical protein
VAYKEADLNEKLRGKIVESLKNQKQIAVEIIYDTNGEIYKKDKTIRFPAWERPDKIKKWLKWHEKEYPDSVVISSHHDSSKDNPTAKGHTFYYGGGESNEKTLAFAKDMRRSLLDSIKGFYYDELQNTTASIEDVEKFMKASIAGFRSKDEYYENVKRMAFLKGLSKLSEGEKYEKEKLPSYAMLIELGFMTNKWELGNLTQDGAESFVNKAAEDEVNGLIKNLKKLNATKIVLIVPAGDHPDDTYDYSSYVVTTFPMVKYKVKALIGILENGYYFEATKLLDKLNHEYTLIDPSSFDPSIAHEI